MTSSYVPTSFIVAFPGCLKDRLGLGNGNCEAFKNLMEDFASNHREWIGLMLIAFGRESAIGKYQKVYGKMIHHQELRLWLPDRTVLGPIKVSVAESCLYMKLCPGGPQERFDIDVFRVSACSYSGVGTDTPPPAGTYLTYDPCTSRNSHNKRRRDDEEDNDEAEEDMSELGSSQE
jgi:hypothetical protein